MWWPRPMPSVPRLVSLLLATTSTKYDDGVHKWPPHSATDLTRVFSKQYEDLERPGTIYHQVSSTLRFSFVAPPVNGTSSWRMTTRDDHTSAMSMLSTSPHHRKPIAVYLPGLDGYGISAHQYQFDDLANTFNFWCLTIDRDDRSEFHFVVRSITSFVRELSSNRSSETPVVLIGESCGGVFASAVALQLQNQQPGLLKGLVLVNPATSFDQTWWGLLVPILTSLRYHSQSLSLGNGDSVTPYAVIGSVLLSTIIPDNGQLQRILNLIRELPSLTIPPSSLDQLIDVFQATLNGFIETERRLPPQLLLHRVNWLAAHSGIVRRRLKSLIAPTLIVVGQQDKLLPSLDEANDLAASLANCETLVVQNRGHFVLDENVNLTEAIIYSAIDPLLRKNNSKTYDPILDWKVPEHGMIMSAIQNRTKSLRTFHSPIFISTEATTGLRRIGLGHVPTRPFGRPLLFVGNHQFAGADLRILVAELYEKRGIFVRGLAHPFLFAMKKDKPRELQRRTPGILDEGNGNNNGAFNDDFEQFGAVEVSPKNYYRLLESGQDALLFPGGAKEALSGRKDYPLIWPSKTDFVRTASKFNAIVVPVSAIGMIDSVTVLAEASQLINLPVLGDNIRAFSANMSGARYDDKTNNTEVISAPLAIPRVPARNYFLFGNSFDLAVVDHKNKRECEYVYRQIQAEVRKGLDDLMRARQNDPYGDSGKRLVYEWLFGKAAPTFSMDALNAK